MFSPIRTVATLVLPCLGMAQHSSAVARVPVLEASFRPYVIPAGKSIQKCVRTESFRQRARIAGSLQFRGGSNNDVRVLVTRDSAVVYDSGKRRSVVLSIDSSEPGEYCVILDNRFSLVSAKEAFGQVHIVDWGIDKERTEFDRDQQQNRLQLARTLLDRLYIQLTNLESSLGTIQIQSKPVVELERNRDPNASAAFWTNRIIVNTGLFEIAEAQGNLSDDTIAGVIGHELGHIFYRHYTDGKPRSVWDEWRGAHEINRSQEREADRLGVHLACLAGFDPRGHYYFAKSVAERNGPRGEFGSTHPSTAQRLADLQTLASRCNLGRETQEQSPRLARASRTSPTPAITSICMMPVPNYKNHTTDLLALDATDRFLQAFDDKFRALSAYSANIHLVTTARGDGPCSVYQHGVVTKVERKSTEFYMQAALFLSRPPTAEESRLSQVELSNATYVWHHDFEVQFSDVSLNAKAERAARTAVEALIDFRSEGPRRPNTVETYDVPPKLIYKIDPTYPENARQERVSGTVRTAVVVDASGFPQDVRVVSGIQRDLDEAAIECVRKWRFSPALKGGQPIAVKAQVEVNFVLR